MSHVFPFALFALSLVGIVFATHHATRRLPAEPSGPPHKVGDRNASAGRLGHGPATAPIFGARRDGRAVTRADGCWPSS